MLGISRGALQYKVKKHNIMFSLEEKEREFAASVVNNKIRTPV